ncbi:MAG: DoxX family protein [Nannocystaceae bacterium]|nr:DoxX family protein [Myxococcales bacterium]
MTALLWVNRVLLTLLSISTGAVKLARMEAEMVIFREIGFSDGVTIAFGVVQLIGGLLLLPEKTTRLGAWIMLPTFVFATGVVFANGMIPFGVSSLLFVAMAALHGARWGKAR